MPDTLDVLIRERVGQQRYGLFYCTGEGRFFPDGTEESSGFVVAEDGTHWFFWTDWQDGREMFGTWESELFQEEWEDSAEYRSALAEAGRPMEVG